MCFIGAHRTNEISVFSHTVRQVVGDESSFERYTDAAAGSSAFSSVFPESCEHRTYMDSKEPYGVEIAGFSEPGGISN
jgi:hypothetical protein